MKPTALRRWARVGWLATMIAMAAALVATAWIGARQVAAAATTLNRGQAELLEEATRQYLRDAAPPFDLDALLERQAVAGLTYVAIVDTGGVVLARAGEPWSTTTPLPTRLPGGRPMEPVSLGDRVRLVAPLPFGRPGWARSPVSDSAARPDSAGRRSGRDGPGRGRPPVAVIEFRPTVADRLAAQATRTVILSALVAVALLGAAVMFWRLTVLNELAERRLEQQQRLGILGEMSAVLAHEIRNPLASLKGHAQLLAERLPAGGPDRKKADRVVSEAQRLEALTTDLLDFARSGPIDIRPSDPSAVLRASVEDVDPHGFVVHAEGAPASWPLDPARVRQALTNVLRNARQSSPEGRPPVATIARENGSLVFSVRDWGTGIKAGDEERVFSPFYTTRPTGTGLGLAVARRVAEMHQGTITAHNRADGGAEFRLTIPGH